MIRSDVIITERAMTMKLGLTPTPPPPPPPYWSSRVVVGSIERLSPEFDKLVPPDAKLEVITDGFAWAEGPLWVTEDDRG